MYKRKLFLCIAAFGIAFSPRASHALPITFSAGDSTRSAQATFTSNANQLVVQLTNTSLIDIMKHEEILTAVFFDVIGTGNLTLTRISANLASDSFVTNKGQTGPSPNGVGGEWAYKSNIAAGKNAPGGAKQGISSTGVGIFGKNDRFSGKNLSGTDDVSGLEYGLTGEFDNPLTMKGKQLLEPFIQHSAVFTLGLKNGAGITDITNVSFLYGTGLADKNILPGAHVPVPNPEPVTLLILVTSVTVAKMAMKKKNI